MQNPSAVKQAVRVRGCSWYTHQPVHGSPTACRIATVGAVLRDPKHGVELRAFRPALFWEEEGGIVDGAVIQVGVAVDLHSPGRQNTGNLGHSAAYC